MTVTDFLKDIRQTGNKAFEAEMQNTVNIWSNESCRGYVIAAMKAAGFTREQISKVVEELPAAFEDISVDDAAKIRNA
jgi:Holliday junction resolvasome RuvABC DNA-binding subunit